MRPSRLTLHLAFFASLTLPTGAADGAAPQWPAEDETPVYVVRETAGGVWLHGPSSQPMVNLQPTLQAWRAGGQPLEQPFVLMGIDDTRGGGWVLHAAARLDEADYTLRVTHAPGDPRLRMRLQVDYRRAAQVRSESIRFQVSDVRQGAAVDRAYRVSPVRGPRFTGPLTPHIAFFGAGSRSFAIIGRNGVQGLWARPAAGGAFTVELEVDDESNHPVLLYERCADQVEEMARRSLSATPRAAGEQATLEADIIVGDITPLRVSRFPHAYTSALSLTDHADQSSAAKLEAFAFGRTGALAAGEIGSEHAGFVNRGLGYTKSVFVRQVMTYAPQFDDPAFRRVLSAMHEGVEVGIHSPTGWRDPPAESASLVRALASAYPVRTWIDHQPETNCEAIANQGWNPDSPWYVLDVLRESGVRTLWAVHDMPLPPASLNMLSPEQPAIRRPVIFSHGAFQGFRLFNSSWMYRIRQSFLALLSDEHLDRLSAEWGIAVGHVYLDTHRSAGRLVDRTLLDRRGSGYVLRPEVDAVFKRLQARHSAGGVWTTGIDPLAEHLLIAMSSHPEYLPSGEAILTVRESVKGLTLLVPDREGLEVIIDGRLQPDVQIVNGHIAVVLDLVRGQPRRIGLRRNGQPMPFMSAAHVLVDRRGDEP